MSIPEYLLSPDCPADYCREPGIHPGITRQAPSRRWFITMGHPGFNSPANNVWGYATQSAALTAWHYYATRSTRP